MQVVTIKMRDESAFQCARFGTKIRTRHYLWLDDGRAIRRPPGRRTLVSRDGIVRMRFRNGDARPGFGGVARSVIARRIVCPTGKPIPESHQLIPRGLRLQEPCTVVCAGQPKGRPSRTHRQIMAEGWGAPRLSRPMGLRARFQTGVDRALSDQDFPAHLVARILQNGNRRTGAAWTRAARHYGCLSTYARLLAGSRSGKSRRVAFRLAFAPGKGVDLALF